MKTNALSRPRRLTAIVALYAIVLTGCASKVTNQPLQPGPNAFPQPTGYNQYSPEDEVQIGQQVAAEADSQLPILPPRGPVQDMVSTLGAKLASELPQNPYQFSFKVINQKEINAFALPGGPVRVNLGTVQAADNEAELAGVIAHEIAHVYMRHSTRNATKEQLISLPAAILGSIVGGGAGGQLARLGIQVGAGSLFMKYSRDAESEADYVGAKIMYEAGYNPQGMVDFFKKLEEEGGGSGGPQFLSDHPNPGNRAESVAKAISELPAKQFNKNSSLFASAKTAAKTMKPYTAEQIAQMAQQRAGQNPNGGIQQASQQSIAPSSTFQVLNHNAYQIGYPANWQVYGNQSSSVTIAPAAGVSQNEIAYGVVINGFTPQRNQPIEQSAEQIYNSIRQANPQVQAVSQMQPVNVNGLPAVSIDLRGPSPLTANGQAVAEIDKLVAIQRQDGTVIYMLFIAPERDFSALAPAFQQMLNTLKMRG